MPDGKRLDELRAAGFSEADITRELLRQLDELTGFKPDREAAKTVTESRLTHILAAHPNAEILEKDGGKVVRLPQYDIHRDEARVVEIKVIPDPDQSPVDGILPVINVRTGAEFNPDGDARVSPLGKLYRIVGWTPPSKDAKP